MPIVGTLARLSETAADACLRRTSPWASCEDLAERVGGLLLYVDENVIAPQLAAARASSRALVLPVTASVCPYLRMPREIAASCTERAIAQALWAQSRLRRWTGRPTGVALSAVALEGPDDWDEPAPPPASTSMPVSTASSTESFLAAAFLTRTKAVVD